MISEGYITAQQADSLSQMESIVRRVFGVPEGCVLICRGITAVPADLGRYQIYHRCGKPAHNGPEWMDTRSIIIVNCFNQMICGLSYFVGQCRECGTVFITPYSINVD